MIIVCMNGGPRSGKTTFADRLVHRHGFEKVDLSRPFKEFVNYCLDIGGYNIDKDQVIDRESAMTLRDLYIEVADSLERFKPSIWMEVQMKGFFVGESEAPDKIVIDSVGKIEQWVWLCKASEQYGFIDLKLVNVFSDDNCEVIKMYLDGRHRVTKNNNQYGKFVEEFYNIGIESRDESTLDQYHRKIDRWANSLL